MRDGLLRRIVVNPEKPQVKRTKPGETIVTEIEQLARLYPYAEPIELKVKSIVNFTTQSIGFTQLERLEKAILNVLKGMMDEQMFTEFISRSVSAGGAGLPPGMIAEVTKKLFTLTSYARDVQRFREEVHNDNLFFHQQKFVDHLFFYLSEELGIKSTEMQKTVLRTAIADRISGIINAANFEEKLILPMHLGGAAYDERHAGQIARHLEKLIAQGGYIILANELLGAHS
jgi:hypothetical protein